MHFQVNAPDPAEADTEAVPGPISKKPKLVIPQAQPPTVHSKVPNIPRLGLSMPHSATFATKSTNKTIPIIIGSIAALCIVCVTVIIVNSRNPGIAAPPPTDQSAAKLTQTEFRKQFEEKAQKFLDASAPMVERDLQEAKMKQEALEEEMDRQRKMLASEYGEKFFDGDQNAGYQLVLAFEDIIEMMPESEEQAREWLVEKITKNPVLKPFLTKIGESSFSDASNKETMSQPSHRKA